MKAIFAFGLYRAFLPFLFFVAFPGWLLKMWRRGGFATALYERVGIYRGKKESDFSGAIHLHAVSVGETALALKLLKAWRERWPEDRFVIATGTATGHELASKAAIFGVRVTYAPLDFSWMIRRYFSRFEPQRIILIEGEIWPNLLRLAEKKGLRVDLANARVSPRSAARLKRFASFLRPYYSKLSSVCIQEEEHRELWQTLGVSAEKIFLTGSLKFDPMAALLPEKNAAFAEMLAAFGESRVIILAASTFPGEEEMLAKAIMAADARALPVIVPRHAERRNEIVQALRHSGFAVTLRSAFSLPSAAYPQVFLVDSTGELATWTCHADVVIIGKSFLAIGGQNPAEAILARKPLVLGSRMDNFQPFANQLVAQGAALLAHDQVSLIEALRKALDPQNTTVLTERAMQLLSKHNGATERHLSVLHRSASSA